MLPQAYFSAAPLASSIKSSSAFKTIGEVASETNVPQHVLRFWEEKFSQIRPMKRGGGRRYYRPEDVALLHRIRSLLQDEGYTIKGVQKLLREKRLAETSSVIPMPQPAPDAFPRTRRAFSQASCIHDVEVLPEDEQVGLLRDVLESLRDIRLWLDTSSDKL